MKIDTKAAGTIAPDWNGIVILVVLGGLFGVCAFLGKWELAEAVLAVILGTWLPSPHRVIPASSTSTEGSP